jgi:hypothetical protein
MALLRFALPPLAAALLGLVGLSAVGADDAPKDKTKPKDKSKLKKWANTWTDPEDKTLPIDYKLQGEYRGEGYGVQVIALDKGHFQAVVYPGGLPADGWDGKNRSLLDGKMDGEKVTFSAAKGKKSYKAAGWEKFSATEKFPPAGQKDYTAELSGGTFTLKGEGEKAKSVELKKVERKSKTLGLKPPKDAVVLFDGTNKDQWTGGVFDEEKKVINTNGDDVRTKKDFNSYTVHLEFMTPFRPAERDQGRGNSGFYQVDTYEVQVLDSFGLEGKKNECGGIYKWRDCPVNACRPPLTWQTYDVDFTNAVREGDKIVKKARITVRLNGVLLYDDYELPGPNGGGRDDKLEGKPGPFKLQGHGNPVQYRNVWVVEKK